MLRDAILLGTLNNHVLRAVGYGWSRREELNTPSADYRSAALTLSYTGEGNAVFNAQSVPGSGSPAAHQTVSGPAATNVGISGGTPLWEDWRFQGSLTYALPFDGLGRSQPVGITLTASILRAFSF